MRSVTPRLSERRGCCSLRQNNRTDGQPHPHPPLLESNAGQAKAHEGTQEKEADREEEKEENREWKKNTA